MLATRTFVLPSALQSLTPMKGDTKVAQREYWVKNSFAFSSRSNCLITLRTQRDTKSKPAERKDDNDDEDGHGDEDERCGTCVEEEIVAHRPLKK